MGRVKKNEKNGVNPAEETALRHAAQAGDGRAAVSVKSLRKTAAKEQDGVPADVPAEVPQVAQAGGLADMRSGTMAEMHVGVPVNMVVEQKAPPVKILYIDSCIANNQISIGNGRYITGSGRVFGVSAEQFEGEFMTPTVMKLLDNRKFVVLSGLTDEQRQQYNCFYSEGEVIKSEGVFDSLFRLPVDQTVRIFSELCPEHQRLVAVRFATAFEKGDNRITRDRMEALNAESKKTDPEGMFTPIVRAINERMERAV